MGAGISTLSSVPEIKGIEQSLTSEINSYYHFVVMVTISWVYVLVAVSGIVLFPTFFLQCTSKDCMFIQYFNQKLESWKCMSYYW